MSSTFFHELRTRQQLGYVVGAGNLPLNRHPGLIFYIQSPVAGPQILLDAVEEFIDLFPLAMLEFTEQQWQESKAGLQAQLSERDANLRSRGQRLWVSIGNKDLGFDQRERVCDEVGKLSRADLVRFITQLRSRTSDRLILCSYGQGTNMTSGSPASLSTIHGHFGSTPPPSKADLPCWQRAGNKKPTLWGRLEKP